MVQKVDLPAAELVKILKELAGQKLIRMTQNNRGGAKRTQKAPESKAKEERGEDTDELYDRAIEIVAETGHASISYVQRRLKVGYNRAARMIEQMEIDGVIGPQEGNKPRQVFVRPMELE